MHSKYNLRMTKERRERANYIMNSNKKILKSIQEIRIKVLSDFEKFKDSYSYEEYENNLLSKYDIDPDINYNYIIKLLDYYRSNINNDIDEDKIMKKIFQKIITLPFEKYKIIKMILLQYKDKLLMEEEMKFLYDYSYKEIFYKIVKLLIDLDKQKNGINLTNIQKIFLNFPINDYKEFKIPLRYGTVDLMYVYFINKLGFFFNCSKEEIIYEKYIAFFSFYDKNGYLSGAIEENDTFFLLYIFFCLNTYFKYSQNYIDVYSKFSFCSNYLYQNINYKRQCLKKIKKYLLNIHDIDLLTEEQLKNQKFIMKFNEVKYEFYLEDYFFSECNPHCIINSIMKKTFSFKYDLKNNKLFQNNHELNKIYSDYINQILKSNTTREYIGSIKDFIDYEFIFDNENIINELHQNTLFVQFPCCNVTAITDKHLYFVFINKSFLESNPLKKTIEVSGKSISQSHEYINHCARMLLSVNDFKIEQKIPETQYKTLNFNDLTKQYKDGDDKWDAIMFGDKIDKIYINGVYFLFNISNWQFSIKYFSEKFQAFNKWIQNMKDLEKNWNFLKKTNALIEKLKGQFGDNLDLNKNDLWIIYNQGIKASVRVDDPQCIHFNTCSLWMAPW